MLPNRASLFLVCTLALLAALTQLPQLTSRLRLTPTSPSVQATTADTWRKLRWLDENGRIQPALVMQAQAQDFMNRNRASSTLATSGRGVAGIHPAFWQPRGPLSIPGIARHLYVDPADPKKLLAYLGGAGLFRTEDMGQGWTSPQRLSLPGILVIGIAYPPAPGLPMYVTGGCCPGVASLLRSDDLGHTFRTLHTTDSDLYLATDPVVTSDGKALLVFGARRQDPFPALLRSTDGGKNFSRVLGGTLTPRAEWATPLAAHPTDPGRVVALRLTFAHDAEPPSNSLHTSLDGGLNWKASSSPLPVGHAVAAFAPSDSSFLYVSIDERVYGSSDGGLSFEYRGSTPHFKVLDGCVLNRRFWVFSAGLTNVEVELVVHDRTTNASKLYRSSGGQPFQPIQDTLALPGCSAPTEDGFSLRSKAPSTNLSTCPGCLHDGRFRLSAEWRTSDGKLGLGTFIPLTSETGYFWFFSPSNVEAIVKVLDGCALNRRFWVFTAGLTNVGVELTVTDTVTGKTWRHSSPLKTVFQPRLDTSALAVCE